MQNRTNFIILSLIYLLLSSVTIKGFAQDVGETKKDSSPNYDVVFNDNTLMHIVIKIEAKIWEDINNELDSIFADAPLMPMGKMGVKPPPFPLGEKSGSGVMPPPPMHKNNGDNAQAVDGKKRMLKVKPSWYNCEVIFKDSIFKNVAIRVKGNSSLISAYHSDSKKYSLKLDFDKFNKKDTNIKDGRFYGLKK